MTPANNNAPITTPRPELLTGAAPIAASFYRKIRGGLLFRACGGRGLLEAVRPAKLLAEAFHPAGGVDELLLACEERVAIAADVDVDLRGGAARLKLVPAGAVNVTELIFWMRFGFHGSNSLSRIVRYRDSRRRQTGL
jgi:hypothetical protein